MTAYLLFFLIVLCLNLLPAFGPPTWTVIVLYGLNTHLSPIALVLIGAAAAALGRYLLASAFRHLGRFLSDRTRRNLLLAARVIERKKRNAAIALLLFALSPLPSAQLFEAAGLTGVRLFPFTAAFFLGRLVSYTFYVATAQTIRASSLGDAFTGALTSPWGIGIQVASLALLVLISQIDWAKLLRHEKSTLETAG